MSNKTFLLGVGAQKAGTTWLHEYLSSYDHFNPGACKEYHIWDALSVPVCKKFIVKPKSLMRKSNRLRFTMQQKNERYFDYFEKILAPNKCKITGDITPSYAALDAATFQKILDGFIARSINCKVIFLMRDPIERCWSATRMHRRNNISTEGVRLDVDEQEALMHYVKTDDALMRTNYVNTVTNLRKVFASENIYFGIYESLFSQPSITSFSDFLKLQPKFQFADKFFNVSQKSKPLPKDIEAYIVKNFKEIYEYCFNEFPETQNLWRGRHYF